MSGIKNLIKKGISLFESSVKGKYLIFLSDDWGSVRMKSKQDQAGLIAKGLVIDNRFDAFDILETAEDLELLYEVILKHRNDLGRHPVISAVSNTANPDFEQIKSSGYQQYFYKNAFESYTENPFSSRVPALLKEGLKRGIFVPHLHGREHVNVNWWMEELQDADSYARKFFEHEYFFFNAAYIKKQRRNRDFSASFDVWTKEDILAQKEIAMSSCKLFLENFGFSSETFTPPALYFHTDLEETFKQEGIKWLDISRNQAIPLPGGGEKKQFNFFGHKRKSGLRMLIRNAMFEPNMNATDDGIDACLASIEFAFKLNQPAIISNHRAAFVSGIDVKNRDRGLKALDTLFARLLTKWPDVNFISAHDLGTIV